MVTNKDFELAVRRIARVLGRTCGEQVRHRRKYPPRKGFLDWQPRDGTVVVNSLGSNRWIVFLARGDSQGPTIIRGSKKEIVNFSYDFANAIYHLSKPKMKKLQKSLYGNVYGAGPRKG